MFTPPKADRPHMPGYGIMDENSGSGLLPWNHLSERMARSRNYWVCTTRSDGRPHAAPVWGVWVDEAFYFSTGDESQKGRNLSTNPNVVVHLESGDDVVILEGTLEREGNIGLLPRLNAVYQAKYGYPLFEGNPAESYVLTLKPRVAFAWLEADFPGGATRWRFEAG